MFLSDPLYKQIDNCYYQFIQIYSQKEIVMDKYIQKISQRLTEYINIENGFVIYTEYEVEMPEGFSNYLLRTTSKNESNKTTVVRINLTDDKYNVLYQAEGDGLDGKILEKAKEVCLSEFSAKLHSLKGN